MLVTIVLPFAALIAVVYTLTNLNGDSELAVINASGAPQFAILKPVLLIGLITAIGVGAMSLYFAPLATRLGESLVASVRGSVLSSIINPGQFMALGDGLTFHMRGRNPDGSLDGIFVVDDRDPTRTMTYLADKGAILDNPLGVFLVMSDGVIQQRNKIDQTISMIEFSSYAFDLSSLTSGRENGDGAAPASDRPPICSIPTLTIRTSSSIPNSFAASCTADSPCRSMGWRSSCCRCCSSARPIRPAKVVPPASPCWSILVMALGAIGRVPADVCDDERDADRF